MKNLGADTRDLAYYAKDRATNRDKVFRVIAEYGPVSDREVAKLLGWPINCVTGRRHELLEMSLIQDAGKVKQNGRLVHVWVTGKQLRLV